VWNSYQEQLEIVEGIDKPHAGKYKEITNDSNYDASCTLTSLPVWDLENFKRLIFVVQTVRIPPSDLLLCYYTPILRNKIK
jgi:hypothetical protein